MSKKALSVRRAGKSHNLLLAALPAADFRRLQPYLTRVPAPSGHVFYKRGEAVDYVYFLGGGMASITARVGDGVMVETATVGRDGMVGLEAYLGPEPVSPGDVMMQVPNGTAERLSVRVLRRELVRQGALFDLLGRYSQAAVAQMMQSAACNARHAIAQRCCRWLLTTQDRVGRDEFRLSQKFLSIMLGVRRQSVTVVAGELQAAGLISYRYGHVRLLDRRGLERASCACYRLGTEFERAGA